MSDDINAFVPGPRVHIEGRQGGPLSGLTFAAKDLFDVAGHPTGGGNPDWARANPIPTRHAWAVQRLLDAGAIIRAKRRDARADVRNVFVTYRRIGEIRKIVLEASLGRTPEIEHDFDDLFGVIETDERLPNREWEDVEELGELPTWGNGMNSDRQY